MSNDLNDFLNSIDPILQTAKERAAAAPSRMRTPGSLLDEPSSLSDSVFNAAVPSNPLSNFSLFGGTQGALVRGSVLGGLDMEAQRQALATPVFRTPSNFLSELTEPKPGLGEQLSSAIFESNQPTPDEQLYNHITQTLGYDPKSLLAGLIGYRRGKGLVQLGGPTNDVPGDPDLPRGIQQQRGSGVVSNIYDPDLGSPNSPSSPWADKDAVVSPNEWMGESIDQAAVGRDVPTWVAVRPIAKAMGTTPGKLLDPKTPEHSYLIRLLSTYAPHEATPADLGDARTRAEAGYPLGSVIGGAMASTPGIEHMSNLQLAGTAFSAALSPMTTLANLAGGENPRDRSEIGSAALEVGDLAALGGEGSIGRAVEALGKEATESAVKVCHAGRLD